MQDQLPDPGDPIWTNWGAEQYAIADDGDSIWIGATGSILQWDKATSSTYRYGPDEGLPHHYVFAVAVDPLGNRWFGGDAGLSRLDPAGAWTHFNTENSALFHDYVDGIAVSSAGLLWLSHGLPGGPITQWQPDGTGESFANRQEAVEQAYEQVKQTINTSDIWAVSDDEVWVGYDVYDGTTWQERRPPEVWTSATPRAVRVGSDGRVWILEYGWIHVWDGSAWSYYILHFYATALGIGPDDSVWVGGDRWESHPYTNTVTGISLLPEEPGGVDIQRFLHTNPPVIALLPTVDGLWAIGPGWILPAAKEPIALPDMPRYEDVTHAVMTADNDLFVHSVHKSQYTDSAIQIVDDHNTTMLDDDVWQHAMYSSSVLTAAAPLPGGGLWLAGYSDVRLDGPWGPFRRHNDDWLEYPLPLARYGDIFAESERITWFAYGNWYYENFDAEQGVSRLDDGGTPADFTDDVWTHYTVNWDSASQSIAVDSLGRLWFGDNTGLYRYESANWQPVIQDRAICDIVPATDGTVFVEHTATVCFISRTWYSTVYVIRPDGTQETMDIPTLIESEFDRVATASRRNRLWTVAPDGAIWYLTTNPRRGIVRHDGSRKTFHDMPLNSYQAPDGPLEVDAGNHLWLVAGGNLWRLSPMPGFALDPQVWLLAPGSSRQRTLTVHSISGYSGAVTLALDGLPQGISAAFQTNPLAAGETTQVTLTVDPAVAPGTYAATLEATDGDRTQSVSFTIIIAPTVHDVYAPFAARP